MMLDLLGETRATEIVMRAVETVTGARQIRTPDMGGSSTTAEMASAVANALRDAARADRPGDNG